MNQFGGMFGPQGPQRQDMSTFGGGMRQYLGPNATPPGQMPSQDQMKDMYNQHMATSSYAQGQQPSFEDWSASRTAKLGGMQGQNQSQLGQAAANAQYLGGVMPQGPALDPAMVMQGGQQPAPYDPSMTAPAIQQPGQDLVSSDMGMANNPNRPPGSRQEQIPPQMLDMFKQMTMGGGSQQRMGRGSPMGGGIRQQQRSPMMQGGLGSLGGLGGLSGLLGGRPTFKKGGKVK
jgi:hypothetical protein